MAAGTMRAVEAWLKGSTIHRRVHRAGRVALTIPAARRRRVDGPGCGQRL